MKYNVTEIFDSIEGEGKRTGIMSTFIRLSGCNLRCSYCDTKYAQIAGIGDTVMTEEQIAKKVRSYPWRNITITGGEPLLHDLTPLIYQFLDYDINIETNGAIALPKKRYANVFYTMDWKCPSSGENKKMLVHNLDGLTKNDVLKFVVGNKEDMDEMKKIVNKICQFDSPKFYVSPVFGAIQPVEIVDYLKKNGLGNVYLQIQLHKVIWDPDERGV